MSMIKVMKKEFLLVWLIVIFNHSINSQEFNPEFKVYSNAEGLSQSVVLSIFQDSKNFMWFATEDGLNKFDGYTFKVYRYDPEDTSSISDNWINRIFMEDRDGDIWMVTGDNTINVFSAKYERFKKLWGMQIDNSTTKFQHSVIFIKQTKNGTIWLSTIHGLYALNKNNWIVKPVFENADKANPRLFRYLEEDDSGNIWLGSNKGLLIWNSKEGSILKDYFNIQDKSTKAIQGIKKDKNNNIWVVTEEEIFGFKETDNYFSKHIFSNILAPENSKSEARKRSGRFAPVFKDSRGNLWICSSRGLVSFSPENGTLISYLSNPSDKLSISSDVVTSFYEDKKGVLWFGTNNGLNRFDHEKQTFIRMASYSNNGFITSVFEDRNGEIWALDYTEPNEGFHLNYLNSKQNILIPVRRDHRYPLGLPVDLVYEPYIDRTGNIWLGSFGSGVILYSPPNKKFDLIKHIPGNNNSLAGNSSWAVTEDSKGRLWLALYRDGLDCYDPVTKEIIHYRDKLQSILNTRSICIISAICDKNDQLWIGSTNNGVVQLDTKTGKMKRYQYEPGNKKSISSNGVLSINLDRSGNVLITYKDNGFDVLNPKTGEITNFRHIPGDVNSLRSNSVRYILESSDGNYWISSDGAITLLNRSKNSMIHYLPQKSGGNGILSDKAGCIFEDSKKNIWFGTHGGGLALFNKKTNKFKYWTEKNGLINNVIYGILEDDKNNLWISTNKGLSCFNVRAEKFTNYFADDGLQGEFNANSFYKARNGKFYFGGLNGLTIFNPEEIKPDPVYPKVALIGLQIFNRKVEVLPLKKQNLVKDTSFNYIVEDQEHLYLPKSLAYTNSLFLNYKYKVFTIEFAALKFNQPERCSFMYKMEGFEEEWNLAGNRRFATYTNLPPGKYVFKVTAANADGIWNPDPVKLFITIKPPFYLTWWFISLGVAIIIFASTSFVLQREKGLRKTKLILEEKVKQRTQELNYKNEELTLRNIQILKQKEEIANQARMLKVELDTQNQTSEQALLRSQINPHFLFNTLNNIYSLVYQKSEAAPNAVMKLSEIMRYMLYDTSSDKVFLEKEIQYLQSFIELQLLRLKNRDFVSFEIKGDLKGKQIAPMLLIPFVENAFKHGSKAVSMPGIIIKLNSTPDYLAFEVKNTKNKSGIKDSSGGIGLANVRRRLDLIYHSNYSLKINEDDDKFEIDLVIQEKPLA